MSELSPDVSGTLGVLQLRAVWNHECGLYARWVSEWRHQESDGYTPELPDESFWQHHVWVGYRFAHRRADLRLGVLNLTGEDYRLNPLNPTREPPRHRTFTVRLGFNF